MGRQLLLTTAILLLKTPVLFSQKNDLPCVQIKKSIQVCDSLAELFHDDATYAFFLSVQESASPYYDSLYLPIEIIDKVKNAMIAVYNWLPDSLNMLGYFHNFPRYPSIVKPWEKFYLVPPINKKGQIQGNHSINEISKYYRPDSSHVDQFGRFEIFSSIPINPYLIGRQIAKTNWTVPFIFIGPIDISTKGPSLKIKISPEGMYLTYGISFGACMPPEWPCAYGGYTLLVRHDNRVEYISSIIHSR